MRRIRTKVKGPLVLAWRRLALGLLVAWIAPLHAAPLKATQGTAVHPPAATVRVSGTHLPLGPDEQIAAWVRLGPARVAAAVWIGPPGEGAPSDARAAPPPDRRLVVHTFLKEGEGWRFEAASAHPATTGGALGSATRRIEPRPRLTAFGGDVLLVTTQAVSTCQSLQDACAPLPVGVVFDLSGPPRRLARLPLTLYTGEEPQLRHRAFHYAPSFERPAGRLRLVLTPNGETVVREDEGTHVLTPRVVGRPEPELAMAWEWDLASHARSRRVREGARRLLRPFGLAAVAPSPPGVPAVPQPATLSAWIRAPLASGDRRGALLRLQRLAQRAPAPRPGAQGGWICLASDACGPLSPGINGRPALPPPALDLDGVRAVAGELRAALAGDPRGIGALDRALSALGDQPGDDDLGD